VNVQWRVCFRWTGSDAEDVAIFDYHQRPRMTKFLEPLYQNAALHRNSSFFNCTELMSAPSPFDIHDSLFDSLAVDWATGICVLHGRDVGDAPFEIVWERHRIDSHVASLSVGPFDVDS
jgi:hypothetical protein